MQRLGHQWLRSYALTQHPGVAMPREVPPQNGRRYGYAMLDGTVRGNIDPQWMRRIRRRVPPICLC